MARKPDTVRDLTISVVGLSGTEHVKGSQGVGKSCLCNRYIRPAEDDFHMEHLSFLSAADFGGQIVNNDHFLYWGSVTSQQHDEIPPDCRVHIIEQTEFLDDTTFTPLRSGKTDPYLKRCSQVKIQSAEKYMYICRDQLGLEEDFARVRMPSDKLIVDGFICVIDVSSSQPRPMESQLDFVNKILRALIKTKKPIVIAATKCDVISEAIIQEVHKLLAKKEYKNHIQVVETSSVTNVNTDVPFNLLTSLIDKAHQYKLKVLTYHEADRLKQDKGDQAKLAYNNLLIKYVTDYRCSWNSVSTMLEREPDFINYQFMFGAYNTKTRFQYRVSQLRSEFISSKQHEFIVKLPAVIEKIFPNLAALNNRSWRECIIHMHQLPYFSELFSMTRGRWDDDDLFLESNDPRIPFDFIGTQEAENVFITYRNQLIAEQQRQIYRRQFEGMLSMDGHLMPGVPLKEIESAYMKTECFIKLSHHDRADVYQKIQVQLRDQAKRDFQELLYERSEVFQDYDDPDASITQDDVESLMAQLLSESKCRALDKCAEDRKVIMLNHLGFLQYPIKEQCPFKPNCMENLIQKTLSNEQKRVPGGQALSQWKLDPTERQINLICIGAYGLANSLVSEIRRYCVDDEYPFEDKVYSLDYRTIEGDVSLPHNSLKAPDFTPHGCIMVYTSWDSLSFLEETIDKTFLAQSDERLQYLGLPVVIMQVLGNQDEKTFLQLQDKGKLLAQRLKCDYVSSMQYIDLEEHHIPYLYYQAQMPQCMRSIAISLVNNDVTDYGNYRTADLRILMCMMCGDQFNISALLQPFVSMPSFQVVTNDRYHVIQFDAYIQDVKRKVEIIIASYHDATLLRDESCHGYILVYTARRKASLSSLEMFIKKLTYVPTLIVAVTDSNPDRISSSLTKHGHLLADQYRAQFVTTSEFQNYSPYINLLNDVYRYETHQSIYNTSQASDDYHGDSPNSSLYYDTAVSHTRTRSLDSQKSSASSTRRQYDSRNGIYSGDPWVPNSDTHQKESRTYGLGGVDFAPFEEPIDALSISSGEYTPVYNALQDGQIQRVKSTIKRDGRSAFPLTDSESEGSTLERMRQSNRHTSPSPGGSPIVSRRGSPRDPSPASRIRSSTTQESHKSNSLPRNALERVNLDLSWDNSQNYSSTMRSDTPSEGSEGNNEETKSGKSVKRNKSSISRSFRRTKKTAASQNHGADSQTADSEDGLLSRLRQVVNPNHSDSEKQKIKLDKKKQKEKEARAKQDMRRKLKSRAKRKSYIVRESTKDLQEYVQEEGQLIPRFIQMCVTHIEEKGLTAQGLYRVPGNQHDVDEIKHQFNNSVDFDPSFLNTLHISSVATALKEFIRSLRDPLIPEKLYAELSTAEAIPDQTSRLMAVRAAIKHLPPANHEVLRYITTHLHKIARHHEENQMTHENLSICWWPTIIRLTTTTMTDIQQISKLTKTFISLTSTMIEQYGFFFYNEHEI